MIEDTSHDGHNAGARLESGVFSFLDVGPPWLDPVIVARQLLTIWQSHTSARCVALSWFSAATGQTVCIWTSRTNGSADAECAGKSNCSHWIVRGQLELDRGLACDHRVPEPLRELDWQSLSMLPVSENSSIAPSEQMWIGFSPERSIPSIQSESLQWTGKLLGWSLRFDQQLHEKKLSALAEFAAGAGHEINNPLGSIIGRTSQLLKSETDPEKRRMLETIGAQAYRIGDMIGDVMLFAEPPEMNPETIVCTSFIEEVLEKFRPKLDSLNVAVHTDLDAETTVFADPTQLRILISEPIRNSLQALEELPVGQQREFQIRCFRDDLGGQQGSTIEVVDNGPGLTAEQREHCFDPYYSGRAAGRGLGFGLSKCWRIVTRHGGEISLVRDGEETRCRIWIPAR